MIKIRRTDGVEIEVTEKAFRVIYQTLGYTPLSNDTRVKNAEEGVEPKEKKPLKKTTSKKTTKKTTKK
jgi:hypothetical protein